MMSASTEELRVAYSFAAGPGPALAAGHPEARLLQESGHQRAERENDRSQRPGAYVSLRTPKTPQAHPARSLPTTRLSDALAVCWP